MFRHNYCTSFFALLLIGFGSVLAKAQILNASFETPALSPAQFTFGNIDNWSGDNNGSQGVWFPGAGFFDTSVPDGNQIGYTNATAVAQQTTETLQFGFVTFSAWIGQRNDTAIGTASLELWAGVTVNNGNVNGGTLLSSTSLRPNIEQIDGQFVEGSTTYTALDSDPLIGQSLTVRIRKVDGDQIDFDMAKLTVAPVPAPSAFAAFLIGAVPGAAVLLRRRRKAGATSPHNPK